MGRTEEGAVARVLIREPERIAAAWRQMRWAVSGQKEMPSILDGVVESFVVEIGAILAGAPGSAWQRTQGVLRLSHWGEQVLREEFQTLRRCLKDMVLALGGAATEWKVINASLEEAFGSVLMTQKRMLDPTLPGPEVPFGGLVVECFDYRPSMRPEQKVPAYPADQHSML